MSLPQLIEELTPYLIGWRGYFGFCQTPRVLTNLEAWIRRRIRSFRPHLAMTPLCFANPSLPSG
jgi:hypothetical protein